MLIYFYNMFMHTTYDIQWWQTRKGQNISFTSLEKNKKNKNKIIEEEENIYVLKYVSVK